MIGHLVLRLVSAICWTVVAVGLTVLALIGIVALVAIIYAWVVA